MVRWLGFHKDVAWGKSLLCQGSSDGGADVWAWRPHLAVFRRHREVGSNGVQEFFPRKEEVARESVGHRI